MYAKIESLTVSIWMVPERDQACGCTRDFFSLGPLYFQNFMWNFGRISDLGLWMDPPGAPGLDPPVCRHSGIGRTSYGSLAGKN